MRQQSQIQIECEASTRALRRCHGCGTYSRPFDFDKATGAVLCEQCAEKARRQRRADGADSDPTEVNFLI
jgi:recombinational DNA repair protein (RecF pathway)